MQKLQARVPLPRKKADRPRCAPDRSQLLAEEGAKAIDLIDVIDHLFGDPPADALALLVPTLLVSLRAHGATIEETRKHLAALAPARIGLELAALAGVELTALTAGR